MDESITKEKAELILRELKVTFPGNYTDEKWRDVERMLARLVKECQPNKKDESGGMGGGGGNRKDGDDSSDYEDDFEG